MPEATLAPFTCPDCGRTLLLTPNGSRRRCPECSSIRQKQQIRESIQRRKARKPAPEPEPGNSLARASMNKRGPRPSPAKRVGWGNAHKHEPKPESNMQKIARMAAEACALGLSYGQYASLKNEQGG